MYFCGLMFKALLVFWCLTTGFFSSEFLFAQQSVHDSLEVTHPKRLEVLVLGITATYSAALIGLNQVWYKEQGISTFHFFNDVPQWNQVDKFGHFYSAYHLSRIGSNLLRWADVPPKKAAIYGSVMSQAMMVPIEILDGFSNEYGFSWGDIVANLTGATAFLTQELIWHEQRIKPKFSFHTTGYADLRPSVLGQNINQQLIKDYNGHTYWFSVDIYSFLSEKSNFPKWLNLAIGYGADGMVYGRNGENTSHGFTSHRQFYLSPDVDLSHIRTNKKGIKTLLFIVDMIKIPMPTLEYTANKGFSFYFLYF